MNFTENIKIEYKGDSIFKIILIELSKQKRELHAQEEKIKIQIKLLLSDKDLTNTDRHLISAALDNNSEDIMTEIKRIYKNQNRELPKKLR